MVEPLGCRLDELWVIVGICRRYLPNVMEIVDEA